MEGENPTRRYKWFRPRQAARGAIQLSGPANHATLSLFNDSKSTDVLVVRQFLVSGGSNGLVAVALMQTAQGSAGGAIVPVVSGERRLSGALYSLDTAVLITPDYYLDFGDDATIWPIVLPFQVLEPNWSLVFQDLNNAQTMQLSILWEAIEADELDFQDW